MRFKMIDGFYFFEIKNILSLYCEQFKLEEKKIWKPYHDGFCE